MGKFLHGVFKTVVKEILQVLPHLGEYGSEVTISFQDPETLIKI